MIHPFNEVSLITKPVSGPDDFVKTRDIVCVLAAGRERQFAKGEGFTPAAFRKEVRLHRIWKKEKKIKGEKRIG